MRVFVTGPTSFSGAEIIKKFLSKSHQVFTMFHSDVQNYSGLKKQRISSLLNQIQFIQNSRINSSEFYNFLKEAKPDVFIFHHYYMNNWRSPDYDLNIVDQEIVKPMQKLVPSLIEMNCEKIIYTGSIAEPMHCGSDKSGPYAKSKQITWEKLTELFPTELKRKLLKVVVPNPIGAMENLDRMIPLMTSCLVKNEPLKLNNPNYFTDNLPVVDLADFYVQISESKNCEKQIYRPSGWKTNVIDFCNKKK